MKYIRRILSIVLTLTLTDFSPLILNLPVSAFSDTAIVNLRTNSEVNPLGIDDNSPRFSWQMKSDITGQCQKAYRIMVASSEDNLANGNYDVWDSQKVEDDKSIGILYEGKPLSASTRYFWHVKVWDKNNNELISEPAFWETGLMNTGWDGAKWIGRSAEEWMNLTKFSFDVDFTVIKDAFSIIFGAQDTSNFYMWQVNCSAGRAKQLSPLTSPFLRPHKWINGSATVLENISISSVYPSIESVENNPSRMTITVDEGKITTFINNTKVYERTVQPFKLGNIGFRAASGTLEVEDFQVDRVEIRNEFGNVVLVDTFDETNPYYAGTLEDGKLRVTATTNQFLRKTASDDGSSGLMLRREFNTDGKIIKSARLYATAAGIYDFYINGQKISSDYFNPGRTTLDVRAMYQTFDVTPFLRTGKNAIGAVVANGWYILDKITYGNYHSLYAKMVITYENNDTETIVTNEDWKYNGNGPLLKDDFWQGETYDANKELPGWDMQEYDDSSWRSAGTQPQNVVNIGEIVSHYGPTIKHIETLPAKSVASPAEGVYIYDFEQNFAGTVRITASGTKGQTIRLRYAEMLNDADGPERGCDGPKGTIYQANLRTAANTDRYIMSGDPTGETYQPSYVYHGFRYLEITGIDTPLPLEAVEGIVLSSEMKSTGSIETSDPKINQLYSNTLWSQKSNFFSVPTDCPQRDERRGFTGDAQIFARTAMYNMDSEAFFLKFMQDVCDNQTASGAFPHMAPSLDNYNPVAGGWMDAGIIIPWQLYQQYGNTTVIEKYYNNMCRFIQYLLNTSTNYIRNKSAYGDWLYVGEATSNALMDTAFCAYSSELLSKMAAVIGKNDDCEYYKEISEYYKVSWRNEFTNSDGTLKNASQTGYALGIYFDIFSAEQMEGAAKALVNKIKNNGNKLTTGFVGISYLVPALSKTGQYKTAFALLKQEEYPSWIYPINQGATTMWERWNSYTAESGFGSAGMNSFNHYAYGSIMEWVYSEVAGIERDEMNPGFKHINLQPATGGDLTFVNASYDSAYGKIQSNWKIADGKLNYFAIIPANTTATVYLPAEDNTSILVNGKNHTDLSLTDDGIEYLRTENGKAVFNAAAGSFRFVCDALDGNITGTIETDKLTYAPFVYTQNISISLLSSKPQGGNVIVKFRNLPQGVTVEDTMLQAAYESQTVHTIPVVIPENLQKRTYNIHASVYDGDKVIDEKDIELCVVNANILLQDKFSFYNPSVWTTAGGNGSITHDLEAEQLEVSIPSASGFVAVTGEATWKDYVMESDIFFNLGSSQSGGIVFRYKDANNFYHLRVDSVANTIQLYQWINGTATKLKEFGGLNEIFNAGKVHFKVINKGDTVELYANDKNLGTASGLILDGGKVGYRSYGTTIKADNLLVYSYGEPVETDKATLQQLVTEHSGKRKNNYMSDSWTTFETAMFDAAKMLDDYNALQNQVDSACRAITDAVLQLRLCPVSTSAYLDMEGINAEVRVDVENNLDIPQNIWVTVAMYDDHGLLSMIQDASDTLVDSKSYILNFDTQDGTLSGCSFKVFVWEQKSQKPITGMISLQI